MNPYVCVEPGCTKGRESGHALYRTSPKGQDFQGRCEEHFDIEQHNQTLRGGQ